LSRPPIEVVNGRLFRPQIERALDYVEANAGGGAKGTATVTVPNNSREWQETVTATGVSPASNVIVSLAAHLDADENDAELLDITGMSATAGTDQITVTLGFDTPSAGVVKVNWTA
jgi:hypothetical protein